ncbi:MAG: CapA family protein [Candidatus Helarchaeota archaeon]
MIINSNLNSVTFFAVGDITLNIKDPLKYIKNIFKNSDFIFGNLETVISNNKKSVVKKATTIRFPKNQIKYLKNAGFNILNIANNHILDFGMDGLLDTFNALKDENINVLGVKIKNSDKRYIILEKNNIKIGLKGCIEGYQNEIFLNIWSEKLIQIIKNLKNKVNVLIISVHWGAEYNTVPRPVFIKRARYLINSGANIILGHHPHIIQHIEEYKKGLIIYSLGNFWFYSPSDKVFKFSKVGLVLKLVLNKDGIKFYDIIPVIRNKDLSLRLLNLNNKTRLFDTFKKIQEYYKNTDLPEIFWYAFNSRKYFKNGIIGFRLRINKYGISQLIPFFRWMISLEFYKNFCGLIISKFI